MTARDGTGAWRAELDPPRERPEYTVGGHLAALGAAEASPAPTGPAPAIQVRSSPHHEPAIVIEAGPSPAADVRRHIVRRWRSTACTRCGGTSWGAHGPGWLRLPDENGGADAPVVVLWCNGCGVMEFLHAAVVEHRLLEADRTGADPTPIPEAPAAAHAEVEPAPAPASTRDDEGPPSAVAALPGAQSLAPVLVVALVVLGLLAAALSAALGP